jgi:hypothetical protein
MGCGISKAARAQFPTAIDLIFCTASIFTVLKRVMNNQAVCNMFPSRGRYVPFDITRTYFKRLTQLKLNVTPNLLIHLLLHSLDNYYM